MQQNMVPYRPSLQPTNMASIHNNAQKMPHMPCAPRTLGFPPYLLLELPNTSHMLKSCDQLVSRSLRSRYKQRAKLCLLHHCMDVVDTKIP